MTLLSPTHEWRGALLVLLGAPSSPVNMTALATWAASEGMPAWTNNPLATTEPWPGARTWNSAGVRIYPSAEAGIRATAKTLGLRPYRAVVAALMDGNDLHAIWQAINRSPWCSGCTGGKYPVVLYDSLSHPPSNAGGPVAPTPSAPAASPRPAERSWDYSPTVRAVGRRMGQRAARVTAWSRSVLYAGSRPNGLH